MASGCMIVRGGCSTRTNQLTERFLRARSLTESLAANLSDADASAQSMPDASPAKWHLAHTSWFFETFVLADYRPSYNRYDDRFSFLFNSYYEAKGPRIARGERGLMTRPSLTEILDYRRYVDVAVLAALEDLPDSALDLVELGCHHEEQHQELLLTDLLDLFARNPLEPAAWPRRAVSEQRDLTELFFVEGRQGAVQIGHDGNGFAFDAEGPRHTVWLEPHAIANRLVSNAEWMTFIAAGGYDRPDYWLSDGWAWVRDHAIEAPLHWRRMGGNWGLQFGLDGVSAIDRAAPVRHISYYEADAFARWAGARLPTEAEWEAAAFGIDPSHGNFLDCAGPVEPAAALDGPVIKQLYGDVWEWTGTAFLSYPGFRPAPGAVGEYNGKFMSGQFVLKGGSCATPRGHLRPSYRNFFYPHQRWQFTGVRLAKDI